MDKQENMLRTVLKNEITWLIMIGGFILAFFSKVILPLNIVQIQLAQIQNDINTIKGYDGRITDNSNNIIVLQQEVKTLQQK